MLNAKQKKFYRHFAKLNNATQAAIKAGYSKKTAYSIGGRLLKHVEGQKYMKELQEKSGKKEELLVDRIKAELEKIGFSNIRNYLDNANGIADLSQLPDEATACIESVKKTKTTYGRSENAAISETTQLKLHSKLEALDKLARHAGFYELDNKQRGAVITVNIEDADADNG